MPDAHKVLEHAHHHVAVGNAETGGTPRTGEASYHFVIRNVVQGIINSWPAESRRMELRRSSWWHNRIVQDYALAVFIASLFWVAWSGWGIAVYVAQALFAIFAIEMITYIQHYGVTRESGEQIRSQHAWAHNCWLTNCLTLNITHHSEHHMNPGKPYYELRSDPLAPQLPACYFVMFIAALFPPIWRWVMDGRNRSNNLSARPDSLVSP